MTGGLFVITSVQKPNWNKRSGHAILGRTVKEPEIRPYRVVDLDLIILVTLKPLKGFKNKNDVIQFVF